VLGLGLRGGGGIQMKWVFSFELCIMSGDSPFDSDEPASTFYLSIEPLLNTYYKTYQSIITLSDMPVGPLSQLVKRISSPRLSPFYDTSPLITNVFRCTYVLLRYPIIGSLSSIKNARYFMTEEDIPSVIRYLNQNGYIVEHPNCMGMFAGRKKIIAMVRFSG
jgi:hypothetical protein